MPASRAAFLLLLVAACSSTSNDTPDAAVAADGGTDAGTEASASFPILPYPPGPHGAATGDVVADFHVQGYALSRSQRDSTRLALRDIRLAEVRSDPACTCLLILWNGAGNRCQPCTEADGTLAAAVANDPSLCAIEILQASFDTIDKERKLDDLQPPTRADLDAWVQAGRQPFPVGLVTNAARESLVGHALVGIPNFFVVRPSDMKIAGFIFGRGAAAIQDAKSMCASPRAGPETLATNIAPRALALDATHAFLTDATKGILRVPVAGGATTVLATAVSPHALAIGASNVFFTEHDAAPFNIARIPKTGGTSNVVVTSVAEPRTIATDDTYVYFARADGVLGRVPASGGPEALIASGEGDPELAGVDDVSLYWVAHTTNELVRAPKAGGARVVMRAASANPARPLALGPADVYLYVAQPDYDSLYSISKATNAEVEITRLVPYYGAAFDPVARRFDFLQGSRGDAVVFSVDGTPPTPNELREGTVLMAGQRSVGSIASNGNGFVYWTTKADGGALKRVQR